MVGVAHLADNPIAGRIRFLTKQFSRLDNPVNNLACVKGGKLADYRDIRSFCNWLVKNDYLRQSPSKKVDPPGPLKPILPSLTAMEVDYLVGFVNNLRDKAIISLFADKGILRLVCLPACLQKIKKQRCSNLIDSLENVKLNFLIWLRLHLVR